MSAQEWVVVITAIGLVVERVIDRVISASRNKYAVRQRERSEAKIDDMSKVADATHTLVNSNMGIALRTGAVALRRVADLTGEAKDKEIADRAEELLRVHEAKQAVVDRGEVTPL